MQKVYNILFPLWVGFLLLGLLFAVLDYKYFGGSAFGLAGVFYGLKSLFDWKLGYEIKLGNMASIPSDAHWVFRLYGIVWGGFIMCLGLYLLVWVNS